MSYFKIYPQKILLQASDTFCHQATLFYNFEQYGYLYRDKNCSVSIHADANTKSNWAMTVTQTDIKLKKFQEFLTALNFYLFQVLKFRPRITSPEEPDIEEEFYFEPVYFDILDGRIKKVKESDRKAMY